MHQRVALSLLAGTLAAGLTSTAVADKGDGEPGGAPRPASYVLAGDRVFPEGIAREPGTKLFYVTSTTDGTIFRGDVRRPETTTFDAGTSRDVPGRPVRDPARMTAVGLKADGRGNLVVAGGTSGKVYVLDTASGDTKRVLDTGKMGEGKVFLNDVAISKGYAYVTDSVNPILYRIALRKDGSVGPLEAFRSFTGTPFAYVAGLNANGIAIDAGGKYAIIVQTGTGKLFRVDLRTKAVSEVALGGATVPAGDGLLLRGNVLYVARNAAELIVPVRLSKRGTVGAVGAGITGPQLKFPTTIAFDGKRLLAVNAQFDKRGGTPELPFDVAAIAVPKAPKAAKTNGGAAKR